MLGKYSFVNKYDITSCKHFRNKLRRTSAVILFKIRSGVSFNPTFCLRSCYKYLSISSLMFIRVLFFFIGGLYRHQIPCCQFSLHVTEFSICSSTFSCPHAFPLNDVIILIMIKSGKLRQKASELITIPAVCGTTIPDGRVRFHYGLLPSYSGRKRNEKTTARVFARERGGKRENAE